MRSLPWCQPGDKGNKPDIAGDTAPNVTLLAQQQMQIMHALMVTCISAYDDTVRTDSERKSTLLTPAACHGLIDWMKGSTTSILAALGKK